MHKHPSLAELVDAVKAFVDDTAAPNLTGHAAFHARVASNVLATIQRELYQGPTAEEDEKARLLLLTKATETESLDTLNRSLCRSIRVGEMTPATPGLIDHLKSTAIAQLNIDQPRYSGARRLKEG
ncbi:MAG: DUF6285 domain-containing protein [Pseudomonadota bacterium]